MSSWWMAHRRAVLPGSLLGVLTGCPATPPAFPEGGTQGTTDGDPTATTTISAMDGGDDDGGPQTGLTAGTDDGTPPTPSTGTSDAATSDTTSAGAIPQDSAFRINSLELRDPHLVHNILGDVTGPFNDQFAVWLQPEANGSAISLGLVFSFEPLDQSDGASGDLVFANASCSGRDANTCVPREGTELHATTYTSHDDGPCLQPDPQHLNPFYEAPIGPSSECFALVPFDVVVLTESIDLPLETTEVSAQYLGDPSLNLVSGLLRGFVPIHVAQDTMIEIDGLQPVPLAAVLTPEDRDEGGSEEGWWFYFQFTALAADWTPG